VTNALPGQLDLFILTHEDVPRAGVVRPEVVVAPFPIRDALRRRFCPRCAEMGEDCWWHEGAFTNPMSDVPSAGWCNACYRERYPYRWVDCWWCAGRLETRGRAERPMHQACRREWKADGCPDESTHIARKRP
jgi:hypothetical protein